MSGADAARLVPTLGDGRRGGTEGPRRHCTDAMLLPRPALAAAPGRQVYWWEGHVEHLDAELVVGLIRDVEAIKGRQNVHEAECVLRNQAFTASLSDLKTTTATISKDLKTLTGQNQAVAWSMNWKAWGAAAAIVAGLGGVVMWEAGQLYALEPLRVAHSSTP